MAASRYFLLVVLVMPAVLHSQGPNPAGLPANITVHSDLVLIDALVTDRLGRVVTGLDASRFRLTEDGKEQVVRYCASEEVPVSIGLVLDTSGSMSGELGILKQAAIQFARAGNPGDEYFLIGFRDRPRLALPFTADLERVAASIRKLTAGGNTALLDALHMAIGEMRSANNPRRALLLISDGLDNHSRYTEREIRKRLSELNLPIYAINVYERPSGNRYAIQRQDPGILEMTAVLTGGRTFRAFSNRRISSIADLIASEIRHEYVLGYMPLQHPADGKFRRVRVQVESLPGQSLRIAYREGYRLPIQ